MASPADGVQAQIRNIEQRYGKSIGEWTELIRASGLTRHTEIVAFLKTEYGMAHGAAHRVSLTARQDGEPQPASPDAAVDVLYAGRKAGLRPIHDELIRTVTGFGADVTLVPKKGYLSLRRNKQFAMIQPSTATRIDVGLILRPEGGAAGGAGAGGDGGADGAGGRLEPAAGFNALFTHRVRVLALTDVDAQLRQWLESAYLAAG